MDNFLSCTHTLYIKSKSMDREMHNSSFSNIFFIFITHTFYYIDKNSYSNQYWNYIKYFYLLNLYKIVIIVININKKICSTQRRDDILA